MSASDLREVIKTMTGEGVMWLTSDNGNYLMLRPVTNMENVKVTFWGAHEDDGRGLSLERMASEDIDDLCATLRKSRRWTFRKAGELA